jgi:hypothetical protein
MIAVAARVAVDLNLFRHVVTEGPVTSARLAELCGAEELLISMLDWISIVHLYLYMHTDDRL